jgi:hypothetical protein
VFKSSLISLKFPKKKSIDEVIRITHPSVDSTHSSFIDYVEVTSKTAKKTNKTFFVPFPGSKVVENPRIFIPGAKYKIKATPKEQFTNAVIRILGMG